MALVFTDQELLDFFQYLDNTINKNKQVESVVKHEKESKFGNKDASIYSFLKQTKGELQELALQDKLRDVLLDNITPADKMVMLIDLINEARDSIQSVLNGYVKVNKEAEYLRCLETIRVIRNFINEGVLDNYFEQHKYYEYRKPEMKLLVGLCQGFVNAANAIDTIDRKAPVQEAAEKIKAFNTNRTKHIEDVQKFINDVQDAGIKYADLDDVVANFAMDTAVIDKEIANLQNDKLHNTRKNEIEGQMDELKLGVKDLTDKMDTLNTEVKQIEAFVENEMAPRENELKAAQHESAVHFTNIKKLEQSYKEILQEGDALTNQIDRLNEYDKVMKGLIENSSNKGTLQYYEAEKSRIDGLNRGLEGMVKLMNSQISVSYLKNRTNGFKDFKGITSDEQSAIDIYLAAKNSIIANYDTNQKNNTAKQFFDKLEKEAPNLFVEEFMTRHSKDIKMRCYDIETGLKKIEDENKELLDQYTKYREARNNNYGAGAKLNIILEQRNQIMQSIEKEKLKYNESSKVLNDFDSFVEKNFGIKPEAGIGYDKVLAAITTIKISKANEWKKLHDSQRYTDFKSKFKKLQTKLTKEGKEYRKSKIEELKNKKQEAERKYNAAKAFQNRKLALTQNLVRLNSQQIAIHDIHKTDVVDKPDAITQVKARLEHIKANILNKSKKNPPEMSDSFKAMYDAIGDAIEELNKPDILKAKDPEAFKNCINAMKEKLNNAGNLAKNYLTEKSKQWRPWLFTSEQRSVRRMYGRELVNLQETAAKLLDGFTKDDITIQKFFAKEKMQAINDPEMVFANELDIVAGRMKEQGKFHEIEHKVEDLEMKAPKVKGLNIG